MNKGTRKLQRSTFEFFLLVLMGMPITIISSEFGPPILSLVRPSSLSPTQSPFSPLLNNDVRFYSEKTLNLEDFPSYATVLPITEGKSWIKSEELLEMLGKESPNEGFVPFTVTPPEGYGTMVVIQELQIPAFNTFNRSLLIIDDNGKIIECFSKFVFQIEGKSPVEICGRTNDENQFRLSVIDGVGPRSFVVPIGKSISVKFVYRDEEIDNNPTLSKRVPFYDVGYLFRASISFTAYKACPHGPPFFNENNEKLWPCDIPQSSREVVAACIREDLFCDSVINCGMHDNKEFAVDEKFCKEKLTSNNDSNYTSPSLIYPRRKQTRVDTARLEEAIRNRIIHNNNRPFGYNDMIIQMGGHPGKGSTFAPESVEKTDTLSHPAFVALIVLITIICVLIVGIIFRFCCKSCVGKGDPYGDSSNPEAVARFHENLRTRDVDANGQSGRPYGISFDSLFKPVEDLPPSYTDLFPQDVTHNNGNIQKVHNPPTSSTARNAIDVEAGVRPSEYAVPVTLVTPESSRSINIHTSQANGNQPYFLNPAFIHVEVLPGNSDTTYLGRRNDPISVNSDEDNVGRSTSHQNHHAYI